MKQIKGNLITLAEQGEFDLITHGCNCLNTFGAGIAKEIKQRYPQAYKADLATKKGDKSKLGNITTANCGTFYIVNAYTQFSYAPLGIKHFNNNAFEQCLENITDFIVRTSLVHQDMVKVGFPLIGCGLAGGSPLDVIAILENWEQGVAGLGVEATLVHFGGK